MNIVLITGADRGLGLAMVKALSTSANQYTVLLSAKSFHDAAKAASDLQDEFPAAKDRIIPYEIDVTSDDSIHAAAQSIERTHGRIDVLINNAGVLLDFARDAGQVTMREAWVGSWDVNVVGAQVMTTVFVPLLLRSSNPRLLFVSSGTSSLAGTENASPGNSSPPRGWPKPIKANGDTPAYRASKSGLNMMMREWHRMLSNDGVKVWAVSPGFLATELGGASAESKKQFGAKDPALGGQLVRDVLDGKRDADAGRVVTAEGGVQDW